MKNVSGLIYPKLEQIKNIKVKLSEDSFFSSLKRFVSSEKNKRNNVSQKYSQRNNVMLY